MASIKSRVGRAIIAGGMLALVALTTPAHASGDPAPVLSRTSLANGWSHLNYVLSASYSSVLVRSASSVSVTDKNGTDVGGVTTLAAADKRILIFTPDDVFTQAKAPYTATFSAHALDQDPTLANTIDVMTFKVDNVAPATPTHVSVSPLPLVAGLPYVLGPTDTLTVAGDVNDGGDSGISRVDVNYYNPLENLRIDPLGTISNARFDKVATQSFHVSCSSICPSTAHYTFTIPGPQIGLGLWTVKISAIDLAGNVSGESSTITMLVVRTPA